MYRVKGFFVSLAYVAGLLAPAVWAQKTPGPTPAPPPSTPTASAAPASPNSPLTTPDEDLVMFLRGSVATDDGTPVPANSLVERVCYGGVKQQVYASSYGQFSMQMGSMNDSFLDATGDRSSLTGAPSKASVMGIPRRELTGCEVRASAPGFRSDSRLLVGLTPFGGTLDVGSVLMQRTEKVEGATFDAAPYKAPKDAVKAYEKGLAAERNGKLADARDAFAKAAEIYPRYAHAWFHLGTVLERENKPDEARTAYTRATTADSKFLPPYLSLAVMAYQAENWAEVLSLTGHILDVDPLNHAGVSGYIVDLDARNCAEAYFYNAFANFRLNRLAEAEKNALKAEQRVDLTSRLPQVHLLLADIFAREKKYDGAIAQLRAYLEVMPQGQDAEVARQQLAKLEKLPVE